MRRSLPASIRARAKAMIGEERRARALPVAALAAMVGVTPRSLEEYERPGGPCPSRPLFAALGYALGSPALVGLMVPPGWLVLSPAQVELVRPALAAAGILPG